MSKVIFCTVRTYTNSPWLDAKLLQLTYTCQQWWADRKYKTVIVDSYADLNQYIDQCEWLVVQTAGDIILEQSHLWKKLHSIPDDIGFIGHLVWYDEPAPHIHPQCFILRTGAVRNFDLGVASGMAFIKSPVDLHQGHSPAEVFLNYDLEVNYGFGTDILQQVLHCGYRAVNFDWDWRFGASTLPQVDDAIPILKQLGWPSIPTRGYCFPENSTQQFEQALQTLDIVAGLDMSQELIIAIFNKARQFANNQVVNVLHWDSSPDIDFANCVICPAGGLLGETLALQTNAKSIVFYDINPNTLEFKRSLYTEWDGVDYISYANSWAADRNLIVEPRWEKAQQLAATQDIKQILDNWNYYKSLDVKFVHCDLVVNPTVIADYIVDHTILHTSNILNYYLPTAIVYTAEEIQQARDIINSKVIETNSNWTEI